MESNNAPQQLEEAGGAVSNVIGTVVVLNTMIANIMQKTMTQQLIKEVDGHIKCS